MVRGEWGPQTYQVVPGHEFVGIVTEVDSEVTKHAVGDGSASVAWSTPAVSARMAALVKDGTRTQGGYSTHVVVTEDFVVRVPEELGLDEAAPLLCGGATTYSPRTRWAPRSTSCRAGTFDGLLNPVSGNLGRGAYMNLLALDGAFVALGASSEPEISFPMFAVAANRRVLTHSLIAGVRESQEMLDFVIDPSTLA
ncbi:alcohol dehydrogenase catalytic domain-containing protein [Streptomyces canus]|uniref:alcohol dehydrogenase catalytic domain-containing protein n=1 Tax=Streptomyces canus TaxID=58343 RepID=UPI00386787AC